MSEPPEQRLRLCILTEFFHPDSSGGTAVAMSSLARELHDSQGIEVAVVAGRHRYKGGDPWPARDDWDGIVIERIAAPDFNRAGVAKRTIGNLILTAKAGLKLTFGPRYDAILVSTAPPFLPMAASFAGRLRRTPFFYIVYDLEPDRVVGLGVMPPNSAFVKAMGYLQRRFVARAARVFAIGRDMLELLSERHRMPAEKGVFVPVGAADPGCAETEWDDAPAGAPEEPLRVLYSGNLGRYHDFDTILDAAKILAPAGRVQFTIVGDGAKRAAIEARLAREHIPNVTLRSLVPASEYGALLAGADVCLVTMESGIEGTCVPSKFYSIIGSGKPVLGLVHPRSEVARAIEEEQCGFTVAQGDPRALVEVLSLISEDRGRMKKIGKAGRKAFERKYTIGTVAARMAAEFRLICRKTACSEEIAPSRTQLADASGEGLSDDGPENGTKNAVP
ncbi:MAG: glycosyltransferase family 4 protein [Fimbriimonadaceae bacterium]